MNRFYESLFKARLHSGLALFAVLFVLLMFGSFVANAQGTLGATSLTHCPGNTVSLYVSGSAATVSYSLYKDNLLAETKVSAGGLMGFDDAYTFGTYTCTLTTGTIAITESTPPTVNPISGAAGVCLNSTTTYASTTPGGDWSITGGTGTATITSGGVATGDQVGTCTVNYTVTDGTTGCSTTETKAIDVYALPTVAAIAGGQASVCVGQVTAAFTCATPDGDWGTTNTSVATINESGVVSGLIAGTVTVTYTVTNVNGCITSVTAPLTVNALPTVAAIAGGATNVCVGNTTAAFTCTTPDGVWSIVPGSPGAANITSGGVVTGVTAGTVTVKYEVTNINGCITSVTAPLTVNALPNITKVVSGPALLCEGTSGNITVALSESGVNYQLRNNTGNVNIGDPVPGNGGTINLSTGVLNTTTTFNVLATNATTTCSAQLTQTATVTVLPSLTPSIIGVDRICELYYGTTYYSSITSTDYKYTWTVSNVVYSTTVPVTAIFWVPIGSTLNVNWGSAIYAQVVLRVEYTSLGTCYGEDIMEVFMDPAITGNTITPSNSKDQTICIGAVPATIDLSPAGGGGLGNGLNPPYILPDVLTYTYQWQSSTTSALTGWSNIASSNVEDYTPGALGVTTWFRRLIFTNSANGCSSTSGAIKITTSPALNPGAILTTGETICYNGSPTVTIGNQTLASGGSGDISYEWKSSADNFGAPIGGQITSTYTISGTFTQTTSFKRYAKDTGCSLNGVLSTGTWTVTVLPNFNPGTISSTGEYVCYGGTTTSTITSTTAATGGNGSITYEWRKTPFGGTETLISGTNSPTYTLSGTFTQTTTFKRYAKDGRCNTTPTLSTGTYTVTVYAPFNPGVIANTGETVCYGGTATSTITSTTAATGGNGVISYVWKKTPAGGAESTIGGAVGPTYLPTGTFTQTTTFKRYAKDTRCNTTPELSTGTWTVTVRSQFTPGAIANTGIISCGTYTPTFTIGSETDASGGGGTITYSWKSSADNFTTPIAGQITKTYTVSGTISETTSFRRYAKDAICNTTPELSTGTFTVTINTPVDPNSIVVQDGVAAPPAHVAYQYSTHTYSVSPAAAGNSYQWSVTGGTITSSTTIATIYVNWDQQVTTGTVTVTITGCNQESIGRYTTVTIKPNYLVGQVKYYNAQEGPMPSPFMSNANGMEVPDYFYVSLVDASVFGGRDSFNPTTDAIETKKVEEYYYEAPTDAWPDNYHPLLTDPVYEAAFGFTEPLEPGSYRVIVWDGGFYEEYPLYGDGNLGQNWTWNNWGGVNATDALLIQHMSIGNINKVGGTINLPYIANAPYTGSYAEYVANVNASTQALPITALDALLTSRRAVGLIQKFPNNKPNFAVAGLMVDSAAFNTNTSFPSSFGKPLPTPFTKNDENYLWYTFAVDHFYYSDEFEFVPGDKYLNIYYNAVGDINASYKPVYGGFKTAPALELQYENVLAVNKGDEVTIPVSMDSNTDLGALSLGLTYRNDLIEVIGTNYGEDFANFDHNTGTVSIAWASQDGVSFNANEAVALIKVRVLANIEAGTRLFELTNFSELADVNAEVIEGVNFKALSLNTDAAQTTPGVLTTANYPNPFNDKTIVSYTLPEAGAVNLVVYNKMGQIVKTFVNEYQTAGVHQVTVNSADLNGPGVYLYKLDVKGETNNYSSTNSMILVR